MIIPLLKRKKCNVFGFSLVAADAKEVKKIEKKAATAKAKPATKAPAKSLPEMMEEDVIPSLKGKGV